MSIQILKCPTEEQWIVIIIGVAIILGVIGLYYALESGDEARSDYKLFLSDMKCDTLEFQALHHEYESYRSLALNEHGSRC